jgi:hypothetical protein
MSSITTPITWWFVDWHLRIMLVLGAICLPIVFLLDYRGFQCLFGFFISFFLVFFGQKLYESDTSENWLEFSIFKSAQNVIGGILILFGWMIFLRGVFAIAIASLVLYLEKTK